MKPVFLLLSLLACTLLKIDAHRINLRDDAQHSLRPLLVDNPTLDHSNINTSRYLPIVLWHGMGDSCCDPRSIGAVVDYIKALVPDIFVHSISTGVNEPADISSSYFGLVDNQVDRVCDEIRALPQLQHGYTAVGFSQGGQFLRAAVQRCQHRGPMAHTLVTMGAQHEGVMDIPGCWEPSFNSTPSWGCRAMQRLLGWGVYNSWIQNRVIQAQYFKDPAQLDTYFKHSAFLADINAEAYDGRSESDGESSSSPAFPLFGRGNNNIVNNNKIQRISSRYELYKTNLLSLKRLVLFVFDNDITVVPKESAHFGFFDGEKLISLVESKLYIEDRLGLRQLDESGRLVLAHAPGFHMQFSLDWFFINVVKQYLLVEKESGSTSTASFES